MERSALLAIALSLTLVLAGCSGLGGTDATTTAPGEEPTTAPDPSTAPADPTTTTQTSGAETNAGGTVAEETTTDGTGTGSEQARQVRANTLAWMEGVTSYRVNATIDQQTSAGGVTRNVTTNYTARIDAADRQLGAEYVQSAMGRTISQDLYVVDRTIFVRNEQYVRQYGSEWIKFDASGNFSTTWQAYDTVAVHGTLLNASTVSLVNETTVDGTPAYVLRFNPDLEAVEDVRSQTFNASNVNELYGTVWIATDDHRLLQSHVHVNQTVTAQGQQITTVTDVTRRFGGYDESIEVTLPEDAEDAVDVRNRTTSAP
ncbi:MAG: hypothetical protein V5A33_06410 [Halobacteriales archaeon]